MSHDLFALGIPIGTKPRRTADVYAFVLVELRVAGTRELGHRNPFELSVLVPLPNSPQSAIIGNRNLISGGVLEAIALLAIDWLPARYQYTLPTVARWLDGITERSEHHERERSRTRLTRPEHGECIRRTAVIGPESDNWS